MITAWIIFKIDNDNGLTCCRFSCDKHSGSMTTDCSNLKYSNTDELLYIYFKKGTLYYSFTKHLCIVYALTPGPNTRLLDRHGVRLFFNHILCAYYIFGVPVFFTAHELNLSLPFLFILHHDNRVYEQEMMTN
jgi:hypothetical protein